MVNGGTDFAFSVGKPAFHQHLAFVSGLYTHIFLFHLMHLRMGGVGDLMDRSGKWIVPQASVGAFLHFVKVKLRFDFSGCLVKNTLGTENFLCGDGGLCRVQPVRRTVGTVDVLSKCGIGTFFCGELQTGGRALPCGRTIPHRLGVSLFRLSCAFLLMVFRRTQGLKLLAFQGVWMFLCSQFPLFFPCRERTRESLIAPCPAVSRRLAWLPYWRVRKYSLWSSHPNDQEAPAHPSALRRRTADCW